MNRVFLIGNLTRDPELAETPNGIAVCHFAIAVNRSYTGGSEERITDFFNITCWRGLAENVAKYTKKGSKVAIDGSIQIRNYEDKEHVKRTAVDIIASNVEFLTARSSEYEGDAPTRSAAPTRTASSPATSGKKKPVLETFEDDGTIPF